MKSKILLVDDDVFTRRLFVDLLRNNPVELQTASDLAQARHALQSSDFNLIVLDQRLPDGNGLEFFAQLRIVHPNQIAILITGFADAHEAARAVHDGLFSYLTKPFENLEELEALIGKALEMDRAYREIAYLRKSLPDGSCEPFA